MPELTGVIAYGTLLATCGADEEILARIVAGLGARLPRDLANLRSAIANDDLPNVREAAHKLYGMVAAFSTIAGAEVAAIEDQAERGESSGLLQAFAQLERTLDALVRELPGITVARLEARAEPP